MCSMLLFLFLVNKCGHTRAGPKNYFNFHVQALSMAAVKSNSDAILGGVNRCKQEASACSSSVGRA